MHSLYYGDSLDVLRWHVEDESFDLIYLDPPFNPRRRPRRLTASSGRLRVRAGLWKHNGRIANVNLVSVEAASLQCSTKYRLQPCECLLVVQRTILETLPFLLAQRAPLRVGRQAVEPGAHAIKVGQDLGADGKLLEFCTACSQVLLQTKNPYQVDWLTCHGRYRSS
jgi:ribosomal protein L24E